MNDQLVTAAWLKQHLGNENLIILDASQNFDGKSVLPGARHIDIKNTFSDPDDPLPNSLPSSEHFEKECQKIGINRDTHLVVYDNQGIFTSPRVWWMFRTFGHTNISVLDGGLPQWIVNNFPTQNYSQKSIDTGNFKATLEGNRVKTFNDIAINTETQEYYLLDARSSGRFRGTAPEPRAQLKSGAIKNSINLPYTEVLDGTIFKSNSELRKIFDDLNISDKPIIFSCGSGITACIILFAHHLINDKVQSVYDGSWTDWATKKKLFVPGAD